MKCSWVVLLVKRWSWPYFSGTSPLAAVNWYPAHKCLSLGLRTMITLYCHMGIMCKWLKQYSLFQWPVCNHKYTCIYQYLGLPANEKYASYPWPSRSQNEIHNYVIDINWLFMVWGRSAFTFTFGLFQIGNWNGKSNVNTRGQFLKWTCHPGSEIPVSPFTDTV